MSQDWKTVKDVGSFLQQKGVKRTGNHNMSKRIIHWPYCSNCGLVALKNDVTRKALKAKCVWED